MQNPDPTNITGTAINYLYICQRKLWFYRHHLDMEHTSESVDLGQASFMTRVIHAKNAENWTSTAS